MSANDDLYKTVNGGVTWNKVYDDHATFIFFSNNATGYLSTSSNILKTSDEAKTWQILNKPSAQPPADLHFITPEIGFASLNNEIYKTIDGSRSWKRIVKIGDPAELLIELCFIDENHGWACGNKGTVLRYVK